MDCRKTPIAWKHSGPKGPDFYYLIDHDNQRIECIEDGESFSMIHELPYSKEEERKIMKGRLLELLTYEQYIQVRTYVAVVMDTSEGIIPNGYRQPDQNISQPSISQKIKESFYWSDEELAYLKKNYATATAQQIARKTGRTVSAVRYRAGRMGLPAKKKLMGVTDLDEAQDGRYSCMVAAFAKKSLNPMTIRQTATEYVLSGKKDIAFLIEKAYYQPDNYSKRAKSKAKQRRIFTAPVDIDHWTRVGLLFAWARREYGRINMIPAGRGR